MATKTIGRLQLGLSLNTSSNKFFEQLKVLPFPAKIRTDVVFFVQALPTPLLMCKPENSVRLRLLSKPSVFLYSISNSMKKRPGMPVYWWL